MKNRVALEFFAVLKYILLFRIFEELAVALKTEFALKPGGAAASYAYATDYIRFRNNQELHTVL